MIADRASVPLYVQLADTIRTQIQRGVFVPGQAIPGESYYMREFHVSRAPIRRAVAVLRQEGLIVTTRRGSFVRGGGTLMGVPVECGRISVRVPTDLERRELGIDEGVPLIVVERDGQDAQIYPGDRAFIQIGAE